jgi:hypothetical protein
MDRAAHELGRAREHLLTARTVSRPAT